MAFWASCWTGGREPNGHQPVKSVNYDRDAGSVDMINLAQMEIGLMSGDQSQVQKKTYQHGPGLESAVE